MKIVKEKIAQAVHYAQNNPTESLTQIALQFGIDRHTLSLYHNTDFSTWIFDSNKRWYVQLEPHEKQSIEEFKNGTLKSAFQVKKKYGIHNDKFKIICGYCGIEVKPANVKHHLNRNALASIQTEEDAYILGFITADGYIADMRNTVAIKLQAKDEDILRKISQYFEYDGTIKYQTHKLTGNKLCSIIFCSAQLIQNLKQYGVERKKSLKETFYENIPPHLIRHYIRGLIDGDGFVSQKSKKIGLCGSEDIVVKTVEHLNKELNLSKTPKVRQEGQTNLYRVEFSGDNAVKVMKYLYEDSRIYLDRKYELAKRYF